MSIIRSINNMPEKISVMDLWPRFTRARKAVRLAVTDHLSSGEVRQHHWSDNGLTDYSGEINDTRRDGIDLIQLKYGGMIVDSYFESGGERGKATMNISCQFRSKDGMFGVVEMSLLKNAVQFEGYWLSYLGKYLRLEQVVNDIGEVFNRDQLTFNKNGVARIPGMDLNIHYRNQKFG